MTNVVFDHLTSIIGRPVGDGEQVSIAGKDPVLPTRFPVGEMAAGIHAACGLAAADIWELRTGRRQRVDVNVRAAAASLQSYAYLKVPETPPARPRSIGGFYPTRDGRYFFVHPSFPHHREATLKLLGCDNDPASAAEAVKGWDAIALEDAFAEDGLCGAIARTAEEWADHPQGQALSELPVIEITKIGDSPPEPFRPGDRPLSGIRVLDLTRVLAGPTCGRTLAEHGADVLRIGAEHLPSAGAFVIDTGHGKRSAFLDLDTEDDREKLWGLVSEADVLSQSYRLGGLAGRGFSPEAVAERRPGIVYVSLNCYGHVGPWSGRHGWEQLGQTVSGLAVEEGGDAGPRLLPAAVTDYSSGYLLAFGALVALARRAREGGSYLVHGSLTQSGTFLHGLGRVAAEEAAAQGRTLPPEEANKLTTETDTPYGRITHLAPVVQLSETPARWTQPTVPLGTHEPVWLDRV